MVSSNIGAGQPERALRIALTGGAMAFGIAEVIGLAAAIWPRGWLLLFGAEPQMLEVGSAYLRTVGPFYGFFALGFTLYFASLGAGRLAWPLAGGAVRLVVAIAGGWLAFHLTNSLAWFFAVSALAMFLYGTIIVTAIASGQWFSHRSKPESRPSERRPRFYPFRK